MINSIQAQATDIDSLLNTLGTNQAAGVQATQSSAATNAGNPSATDLTVDDNSDISNEARQKLAAEQALKPYIGQLQASGEPYDATRVDRFKRILAEGGVQNYLDQVTPQLANNLSQQLSTNLKTAL